MGADNEEAAQQLPLPPKLAALEQLLLDANAAVSQRFLHAYFCVYDLEPLLEAVGIFTEAEVKLQGLALKSDAFAAFAERVYLWVSRSGGAKLRGNCWRGFVGPTNEKQSRQPCYCLHMGCALTVVICS